MGTQIRTMIIEEQNNIEQKDSITITKNLITYYSREELSRIGNVCTRTLHRVIKEIPLHELNQFKLRFGPMVLYSPGLLFFIKKCRKNIQNLEYVKMLSAYSWSYAFTIGFDKDYPLDWCRKNIEKFITHLTNTINHSNATCKRLLIFFSLEQYEGRSGYHIHGAMSFFSAETKLMGKQIFETYYPIHKVNRLLEEYDCMNHWVNYITKRMDRNPDAWDIYGDQALRRS